MVQATVHVASRVLRAPESVTVRCALGIETFGTGWQDFRRSRDGLRSGDEYRTGRVGDDGLGDGAEQPPPGSAFAVRADDDEVGIKIRSELQDLLANPSEGNVPGDLSPEALGNPLSGVVNERTRLSDPVGLG
jgi:hypothetical protein